MKPAPPSTPGGVPFLAEATQCAVVIDGIFRGRRYALLAQLHAILCVDLARGLPIGAAGMGRLMPGTDPDQAPDGYENGWKLHPMESRRALIELLWVCNNYHLLIPDGPSATVRSAFVRVLQRCA